MFVAPTGAALPISLLFFTTELPLNLRNVAHFYSTIINTNRASRPPYGQGTLVFIDKLIVNKYDGAGKDNCRTERSM